jgi:hypothetical protein
MSLLFYDAQTKYSSYAELAYVYDTITATNAAFGSDGDGPYGVGRYFNPWGASSLNKMVALLGSTESSIRFGFWHYGDGACHFGVMSGAEYVCQFRWPEGSRTLRFERGYHTTSAAVIGTCDIESPRNSWHWYECYFGIGNSTGFGYIRMDGRNILSVTGVDTIASASTAVTGVDRVVFGQQYSGNRFHNIMAWNDSGDWPTGWIGPQRTDALLPNGDGAQTDWSLSAGSSGWSLIDSITLSTTDYISSTSTGNISSFDVAALPAAAGSVINAVAPEFWSADVGGGSTEVSVGVIDSSTQEFGTAQVAGTGRRIATLFDKRPGSTSDWSSTDIGGLEIAVRYG